VFILNPRDRDDIRLGEGSYPADVDWGQQGAKRPGRFHIIRCHAHALRQIFFPMATIEHAALWTHDLERARSFYEQYFDAQAGARYVNEQKQFTSYFLSFASGARLEIMHKPTVEAMLTTEDAEWQGYAHLAFSVGSEQKVDALTERLRTDGYEIVGAPRRTGDGYYESVVLDPDGNHVEITV
jgi:lactoylglutathione lyase